MKKSNKKPKLSMVKRNALIAAAGLVLTASGVYASRELLEFRWQLHPVSQVVDGDTIKVDGNTRVRMIGINSPDKGECFYEESQRAVTEWLTGASVYLEKEISGKDNYGRLLRYVFLPSASKTEDHLLVNDYIVRQGWAMAAERPPDSRYRDLFNSAQEEAIREKRGLWAKCDYIDELSERREKNDPPPDASYVIKGNISTRGYGKTYLSPGCDNYNNVKIDFSKGEKYFRTTKEAEKEGFREATNCP